MAQAYDEIRLRNFKLNDRNTSMIISTISNSAVHSRRAKEIYLVAKDDGVTINTRVQEMLMNAALLTRDIEFGEVSIRRWKNEKQLRPVLPPFPVTL